MAHHFKDPTQVKSTFIAVRLSPYLAFELDNICSETGQPRSVVMRSALLGLIECYRHRAGDN